MIHLIASDSAAPIDLPAWCHLTGHAHPGPIPAARPTYAMRTVPARAPTDPASPWRLKGTAFSGTGPDSRRPSLSSR